MTRQLAREALGFGLAPGLLGVGLLYLLDTRLLGRNARGLLVLAGLFGGLLLVGIGMTGQSGVPGFWPRSDALRRVMLYGVVVTVSSAAAIAVLL